MLGRFYKINGQFSCQDCGASVAYARVYPTSHDITWYCRCGFLSHTNIGMERGY